MASLEELRAERDLYITTRTNIQNAINKANSLKDQVIKTSELINEGVKTGGKGFDEGKMEGYSQKMGDISIKLKRVVDYCTEQIDELQNLINVQVYQVNGKTNKVHLNTPPVRSSTLYYTKD